MTRRARTRRFVPPSFRFASSLFLLALLLPSLVSAQPDTAAPASTAPGQLGKPIAGDDSPSSAAIDHWSLEPGGAESWFDAGPGWEPLDPQVLPGREDRAGESSFLLWNGGPSFTGCLVKTDYAAPPETGNGDGRVSVLVNCTLPQTREEKATGYEIAVDRSRAIRILRLDADGKSTVLAESPGAPARMVGGRGYIIAVGRSGDQLTAKVYAKDEPEPGWQAIASDATYEQGRVGVAATGARGRISNLAAIEVEPVVVAPSTPGVPGKPTF